MRLTGGIWTCVLVIMSVLVSCSTDISFVRLEGAVWNTTYSIKFRGDEALADSVQSVLRRVEMSLSPFNEESSISRINRNESMAVNHDIMTVFKMSREVNEISGGVFDPTLSPLINLWGFGYTGHDTVESDDSVIAETMALVGLRDCHIENGMMIKKASGTTFNFSAVTKGYGCDEIARMFKRNGVEDYMIEIGGEIALGGHNDRGRLWRVMVDAPVDSVAGHIGLFTVEITDCGIATSGNYRNFRDTKSGRVGHTISVETGRPVMTEVLSATVIAPDCATADALATACMAMQATSALTMIEQLPSTECLLVCGQPDSVQVMSTTGFPIE